MNRLTPGLDAGASLGLAVDNPRDTTARGKSKQTTAAGTIEGILRTARFRTKSDCETLTVFERTGVGDTLVDTEVHLLLGRPCRSKMPAGQRPVVELGGNDPRESNGTMVGYEAITLEEVE